MSLTNRNIKSFSFYNFFNKKVDFAILSAMPEELEPFNHLLLPKKCETHKIEDLEFYVYEYKNKKILLGCTGIGTTFASSIMTLIYKNFKPNYILFSGTAGAINKKLKIRDVVIVEKAFEAEIQGAFTLLNGTPFESCLTHPVKKQKIPSIYSADDELINIASNITSTDIQIQKGIAVSSNSFPAPLELFEHVKSINPYSIDMETSAIYQAAWLLKARVIAVRGISNILNTDGTDDKIHESDVTGSAKSAAKVVLEILNALLLRHEIAHSEEIKLESRKKTQTDKEVFEIIRSFNLQRHPEGGYYSRTFTSTTVVKSEDKNQYNNENRNAGSSIYYLLQGNDFSAWHRLKSDEMWHYYKGSPVKIYVINNSGNLTSYLLGDPTKYPEANFQVIISAGDWFAAEVVDKNSYCLVGCTVTPAFEFRDFELANREMLAMQFPIHKQIIDRLTRVSNNKQEEDHQSKIDKRIISCL